MNRLLVIFALTATLLGCRHEPSSSETKDIVSDAVTTPVVRYVRTIPFSSGFEAMLRTFGYKSGKNCLVEMSYTDGRPSGVNKLHLVPNCDANATPIVTLVVVLGKIYGPANGAKRTLFVALDGAHEKKLGYLLRVGEDGRALDQLCTGMYASACDLHINAQGAIDSVTMK